MTYTVRTELKPSGLSGISEEQIAQHWKLYEGYVTQANGLKKELSDLRSKGEGGSALYADRRRRFGFEMAGMVLHEYYFGNLKANTPESAAEGFKKAVTEKWGSWDAWKEDFANTGKSRGIGWAVCAIDPLTCDINNHFIQLHEEGNLPGYHPLVVMDVWEHAYMVDHAATARPDYIAAFMGNINWEMVETRWQDVCAGKTSHRFAGGNTCCAA